jgi:hypothetical protein
MNILIDIDVLLNILFLCDYLIHLTNLTKWLTEES